MGCKLDVTDRKQFEERIRNLAFFEQLTRLANRELLQDRLPQAVSACTRAIRRGAPLLFGLENFKSGNETLGHTVADALLQQVAARLAAEMRDGDTIARMGGDEVMVLREYLGPQTWVAVAQAETFGLKGMRALPGPYGPFGDHVHVSGSGGATLRPGHGLGAEDPIPQADIALNQAKASGRPRLRRFDPRMQQTGSSRATLECERRKAVAAGQLTLLDQPQLDEAHNLIGAEARASSLTIACTVSPLQLQPPQFAEQVRQAIARHGMPAERLKREHTAATLQGDLQRAIATLRTLKEEGVPFSLDDFGTGYSLLQYRKRLPLDQLRSDQTFVRDIVTDPNDKAIVATIIAIARHLGLDVIAEGVESHEPLEALRECGCGRLPGRGKPVEPERLFGTWGHSGVPGHDCLIVAGEIGGRPVVVCGAIPVRYGVRPGACRPISRTAPPICRSLQTGSERPQTLARTIDGQDE